MRFPRCVGAAVIVKPNTNNQMKVLKFGGTSVGSVDSILSVRNIVEKEAKHGPVVVVVSALSGITDQLINTSQTALKGSDKWRTEFQDIIDRHHRLIDSIITDTTQLEQLVYTVDSLFDQLRSILFGVYLVHDLSRKTQDAIVSYGERISSHIVTALIKGSVRMNARDFIRTERKNGKNSLDTELTYKLVRESFSRQPRISIVPGFISRDRETGETTNLGRGGSDYTAAIIAAALDAEMLEIWTDVDGFMTADPRTHPDATVIPQMSYAQAQEMCDAGAKVIYPPTIAPVAMKHIPVWVKNTFNPSARGTVIID